jgi:tetratricopeptide (TPR) repeat protein
VPPPAFQAFSAAEALREQPNDSGLDQAIEKYQSALNLDPAFALGYARIAMAYARKFDLSGDAAALSLASNNADLALHYNPHSAQAVLSRALVELFSGKTQSGLDGINQALQLDPGNPRILVYKALAFRNLGRCVEEEAVYREMIKSRPNYWPAYNELGEMRHRYGADEKAAEAFSEASEATPLAATPLTNLGAIDMLLNRDQEAEEAFTKSLQRAQTNLALLQLGTLAFKRKDYRKALDFYGKARDLRPRSDITWRNIGDCYSMLGDSAKVAESYGRAADLLADSIKRNPTRGSAWMTLAFYQAKLGRREEAEKALEEAEKRGSEDVQSQFKKAQVMELLGRNEEALRLVLDCMDKGLARVEVDLALDLAAVRATPQFRNYQQPVTPKPSGCKLDSK